MAYTFDAFLAADPSNPANVAANASITIWDPADPSKSPVAITDLTGVEIPNPITVNANGFGPAFTSDTLDRVGWSGGGFEGFFTSYEGMKNEAVDARAAAEAAASSAGAAAQADLEARIAAGDFQGQPGQDGSNVLPTDTAIKNAITTPGTETQVALSATYAPRGHYDYTTPTTPMMEYATTAGSGRIFHLLSGAGSTSEIMGIGVDNPDSKGVTISCKSSGNIGLGVNLETTSTDTSFGYLGAVLSAGVGMELRKGSQNGGTLLSLRADYGGTGTILSWGQGVGNTKGRISENGNLTLTNAEFSIKSADTNQSQVRTSVSSGGTQSAHYVYSGTPNLWFPNAVASYSNSMVFQQGAAAAIGGETMNNMLHFQGGDSIGFHGVTPVPRQTVAAAATDAATTQTLVNDIRAKLIAKGLIQ